MSVLGIILAVLLLGVLGYFIFRNVLAIVQGIKAKKQAKLEQQKKIDEVQQNEENK